jgi:hypothetical protein
LASNALVATHLPFCLRRFHSWNRLGKQGSCATNCIFAIDIPKRDHLWQAMHLCYKCEKPRISAPAEISVLLVGGIAPIPLEPHFAMLATRLRRWFWNTV